MSRPIIKKQSSNGDSSSRNKSVHFDPAARFILIRPSNGYATGNRASQSSLTRYTDDDYNRIRKGVKKTVRAVRTFHEEYPDGNFDEHQESLAINEDGRGTTNANSSPRYSSRGLEHLRTAECLEQQMINKDCAIESVLVAQERLDEEANTGNQDLDQRIRDIYDQPTTSEKKLRAHRHRLEQRARHIADSYRLHNRWALQNALDLAAQDELYVEQHVRPALEGELRELERKRRRQSELSSSKAVTTDTGNSGRGTVSPLRTLATLKESLAMMEDHIGDGDNENETNNNTVTPPSSLSATTIANMAASRSPSRPSNSAHATGTSIRSMASRPHAPSRIHPPRPTNWLQHRDSLQLSLQSSALDNKTSSEPNGDVATVAEEGR